ncbi:hypothetical protein D3C59_34005 [Streptomyces sp. SHP22-7]|nr:hypothetical protein D3C59_34005 [Streptomyces sp. SHP22-7]
MMMVLPLVVAISALTASRSEMAASVSALMSVLTSEGVPRSVLTYSCAFCLFPSNACVASASIDVRSLSVFPTMLSNVSPAARPDTISSSCAAAAWDMASRLSWPAFVLTSRVAPFSLNAAVRLSRLLSNATSASCADRFVSFNARIDARSPSAATFCASSFAAVDCAACPKMPMDSAVTSASNRMSARTWS